MRFLLKPSSAPNGGTTNVLATRLRAAEPAPASVPGPPRGEASAPQNDISTGKTWAQQCGSDCGCILRFEAQLFECPSSSSPTIVRANYHAKRVMATAGKEKNFIRMKPLTNQRSQPILTSCTCPTLHHIAKKAVEHLNGKTLAQIRNEMNLGVVGSRSSVAHRHTVLRECVLPIIVGGDSKKFGNMKKESTKQNVNSHAETNYTQQHFHCYDLVEGSLLAMIHERIPSPRKDNYAESYSPTLGEYFRMYSYSERNWSTDSIGDEHQVENSSDVENEFSFIHEASDWQRGSPSSFFLFGDGSTGQNTITSNMTQIFMQHIKDSISDRLLGNEIKKDKTETHRPATSYLKLLDMYGIENSKQKVGDIDSFDDWLEFVDRNNYHQGGLA
jgi:hypothetical protein